MLCCYKWKKGLIWCQVQGWKTFVRVFIMHKTLFWRAQSILHQTISSAHLKMERLISSAQFGSFMISEKGITRFSFLHCVARMLQKCLNKAYRKLRTKFSNSFSPEITFMWAVFIDMNMHILTEDKNFKTFLKENYAITLDSCCLFIKIILNKYAIELDIDCAYWA